MNTVTPNQISQEDVDRTIRMFGNRAERRRWEKIKRKRTTKERMKTQHKRRH